MIKCPVCGNRHSVPNDYDNKDFICKNSSNRPSQRTFQDMTPIDLLERAGFMRNKRSTKIDEARAVTVNVHGPSYKPDGEPIGTLAKSNY